MSYRLFYDDRYRFYVGGCNSQGKITSVEYKISLQDAANIYQEEAG
jgi:hypothetical protein